MLFRSALLLVALPFALLGQSASDLAAWNALVLTPVGALPTGAAELFSGDSTRSSLSMRYGRWRYDQDDAIHDNAGLVLMRRIGGTPTTVSLTGGYVSLSCGPCATWLFGGVDVETPVFRRQLNESDDDGTIAQVAVRLSVGGATYRGDGPASATSAAGTAIFGVTFPAFMSTHMALSFSTGVGAGRLAVTDETPQPGARSLVGGAFAWALPRGLVLEAGFQRIVITGGPTQLGSSLSWRAR